MTKPTLEHLRLSAEFCGREAKVEEGIVLVKVMFDVNPVWLEWKPSREAIQDRELRDALLKAGWGPAYDSIHAIPQHRLIHMTHKDIVIACDANDFLTLAAAKLQEGK